MSFDSMMPIVGGLTQVVPPAADPVTIQDAKKHSRIFIDLDDSLIAGYIHAATAYCEDWTRRAFMPQTVRMALNYFPGRNYRTGYQMVTGGDSYYRWNYIELWKPPLQSIVSFTYTDTAGTVSNMTQVTGNQNAAGNYLLDLEQEPGRIVLPFAGIWPVTILLPASPIKITYTCGYAAYSGTLQIDPDGVATWQSGDLFDPSLAGTWITVGDSASFGVLRVIDDEHMQLQATTTQHDTPESTYTYLGSNVPMGIRQGILFLAAHFYENREPVITGRNEAAIEIPRTLDDVLAPYRVQFHC